MNLLVSNFFYDSAVFCLGVEFLENVVFPINQNFTQKQKLLRMVEKSTSTKDQFLKYKLNKSKGVTKSMGKVISVSLNTLGV